MHSEQLKQMQAPIKEKYRNDPGAALITLKAEGKIGEGKRVPVTALGAVDNIFHYSCLRINNVCKLNCLRGNHPEGL